MDAIGELQAIANEQSAQIGDLAEEVAALKKRIAKLEYDLEAHENTRHGVHGL